VTSSGLEGTSRVAWGWVALIIVLIAVRLPSLVQPAGGDQGLYGYAGQRILAGDVMYRDVWDQKPPAIAFVYALLWGTWSDEAVVPGADILAAVAVSWLLILLGHRRYSARVGYGAAVLFLLLGDPYLQRLSGIYVRGQCEPFIALAVTASIVLLAHPTRKRRHLIASGLALATAFWLKYNAVAYVLPVAVAASVWSPMPVRDRRHALADLGWIGAGFGTVTAFLLAYFAVNGALHELWLATIEYNLRYSNETYESPASVARYIAGFPVVRAGIDFLWFLGGIGALLLARRARANASTLVILCWLLAAVMSIAINGSRSLPNYFVQANPAMALAASAGLATLATSGRLVRYAVAALMLAGIWRVGSDAPVAGLRLASLPGLVENVRYDLEYVRGRMRRETYLKRFRGQKHDAFENEALVRYVRDTTAAADPVFVFGFSGGSVCWKSERASSSRFFWSRPVIIEFASERPGYGSTGLMEDLLRRPPSVVALQKEEWRSHDSFMSNDRLRSWLLSEYVKERETPMFSVWRQKRSPTDSEGTR